MMPHEGLGQIEFRSPLRHICTKCAWFLLMKCKPVTNSRDGPVLGRRKAA